MLKCLLFLEKELAALGSMCAASLLKNDTVLPFAGRTCVLFGDNYMIFFFPPIFVEELTVGSKDGEKADMRLVQASAEEAS